MINCLASFCGSRGDSRSTIQFIRTLASLWLPLTDDYLRAGNFLTHSPSSLVEVWLSDCVFLLGTELLSLSRIESVAHCLPCAGQVNYPNCKQCIQGRFGRDLQAHCQYILPWSISSSNPKPPFWKRCRIIVNRSTSGFYFIYAESHPSLRPSRRLFCTLRRHSLSCDDRATVLSVTSIISTLPHLRNQKNSICPHLQKTSPRPEGESLH
jgi:hypothetical protein